MSLENCDKSLQTPKLTIGWTQVSAGPVLCNMECCPLILKLEKS